MIYVIILLKILDPKPVKPDSSLFVGEWVKSTNAVLK